MFKVIYDSLPKTTPGKILDIGCGNGLFLGDFKKID